MVYAMDDRRAKSPSRWTVPQALAWIIYRDIGRVYQVGKKPFSCMDVLNEAMHEAKDDNEEARRCFSARDDFVAKLTCGSVGAYGIPLGQRIHAPIPRLAWEAINTLNEYDERVGPLDVGYDGSPLYRNVLVDAEVVQDLWPRTPKPSSDFG
jgi:hypothetical protein